MGGLNGSFREKRKVTDSQITLQTSSAARFRLVQLPLLLLILAPESFFRGEGVREGQNYCFLVTAIPPNPVIRASR